jgi:hypothetical protein
MINKENNLRSIQIDNQKIRYTFLKPLSKVMNKKMHKSGAREGQSPKLSLWNKSLLPFTEKLP